MRFEPTQIAGVVTIAWEPHEDARGFFVRTLCELEMADAGLPARFEQSSLSRNRVRGTLRGMHLNRPPKLETKLVRCVRGAIFDVVVDLRPDSPTIGSWIGRTLTEENGDALLIPPGCAHGFQTLVDDTDVWYEITPPYAPGFETGVRWNDPTFAIAWPVADPILSPRDAGYPDWFPS